MAILSITTSFNRNFFIKLFVSFFVTLLISVAQAKSGFWTGAAVGYLFNSANHQQTIHKIKLETSYENRLYEEYQRNETIMKDAGVKNREALVLRNQQIASELIKSAQDNYIKAFSLKLTPMTREVIEQQVVENGGIFAEEFMQKIISAIKIPQKSFFAHRDRIRYAISFDESSPQSISDFDVLTVNGRTAEKNDHEWFYTYEEQWGNNRVAIELQNRQYPEFRFTLKNSWFVPTAEKAKRDESRAVSQSNLEESFKFLLMCVPAVLGGVLFARSVC